MRAKIRGKRKDGLQRQASIMEAALFLFAESGYHATAIDDILEATGVSKGTFYLHFDGKHDILEKIIDANLELLLKQLLVLDISAPRPIGEIRKLYRDVAALLSGVPAFRSFVRMLMREYAGLEEPLFEKVNAFLEAIIAMSADYIGRARDEGRVKPAIDPRSASICIIGAVKEHLYRWSVLNEDFDIVEAVDRMLDLFLDGMLAGE